MKTNVFVLTDKNNNILGLYTTQTVAEDNMDDKMKVRRVQVHNREWQYGDNLQYTLKVMSLLDHTRVVE